MRFCGGIRFAGFRTASPLNSVRFTGNQSALSRQNLSGDVFTSSTNLETRYYGKYNHPLLYFLGFNFLMRKQEENEN